MQFRRDIQILRGLAVLFVVLFHLEINAFASGFLGVDVFFVISGFLMAILYQEGEPRKFYERRARRLLPAYFATVVVTFIVVFLIVLPVENSQVVEQVRYAGVFASNIELWFQYSYFSRYAFTPLLHLWSLGVEIQFYLLVPVIYWLGRKHRWVLPVLLVSTLIACFFITMISPKTSFVLMPLRIWQFLIGWIIAQHYTNAGEVIPRRWNGVLGAASLIVLLAIPLMPVNPSSLNFVSGHPGLMALVACLATGGVLAFSIPSIIKSSVVGRGLELLGRYSYSIYLVHFPVLVLVLYKPFSGTILKPDGIGFTLIVVILTAILALLSFHGVEKYGAGVYSARRTIAVMIGIFILSLVVPPLSNFRFSDPEKLIFSAWTDRSTHRCGKIFRIFNPTKISCELTGNTDENAPKLLLVGDSHADSIKSSFARASISQGYQLYFLIPNIPLISPKYDAPRLIREAKELGVSAAFIHYASGNFESIKIELEAFRAGLAIEGIQTVLLMPVPEYPTHMLAAMYRNHSQGTPLPEQNIAQYYKKNEYIFEYARSQQPPLFSFYDVGAVLCHPECQLQDGEQRPAYFDGDHLTLSGARMLEDIFLRSISNLVETGITTQ